MRDKAYLKVSVPVAIAEALQALPEYNKKSITRIIADLTDTKLSNTNPKENRENRENKNESTIN